MMPRRALYDLCEGTLQAIVAGWPAAPETQLPDRQGVGNSDSVWDCEGLTVLVETLYPTQGDVTAQQWASDEDGALGLRAATIAVWLMRCIPDIDSQGQDIILPTAAEVDDSAFDILGDAISVWDIIMHAQLSGVLTTCSGITFENWTPASSGGIGGGVTRFRAQLLPQAQAS